MADIERDIVLRVKSETEQAQGQFKTLKQELRSIEQQLNQMAEAGEDGSEAFRKLQQRAGEVKDQIGDTKAAITALSSDTFKLDAFGQAAQGIAGGFAAAQGAMSLFGGENKAVEEAIMKTQGAMALLEGVTAVTNILQKESAFSLFFLGKAQKANAVATEVGTKATKGFSKALMATGVMALVAGLGFLIANFEDVKKVVMNLMKPFDGIIAKVRDFLHTISFGLIDDASTAKTKENAEESLKAIEKIDKYNQSMEKQMQRNIDIAKAKGKSDKEILKLEKDLLDFRLKNNYAEQTAIKNKMALGTASDEEKKKLFELVESARDLVKDRELLDINYQKGVKKRNEESDKKRQEQDEKDRQKEEKKYQDSIKANEAYYAHLIAVAQLNDQETETLEIQKLEKQIEIEKKYGKDTTALADQIALKKKGITVKEFETLEKANDAHYEHLINVAKANGQSTEQLELEKLEKQLQLQKEYGKSTIAIEDQIALKKKEIADKEKEVKIQDFQKTISDDTVSLTERLRLNKEFYDKKLIDEKTYKANAEKLEKDLFQTRKATAMEWAQVTKDGLDALVSLNEAFSSKDKEGQRKSFERDKKFKIASAITATAMGVAQQLAVPQDQLTGLNFAKAAIVLATGIAQIKKISDTKFEGGGSAPNNNIGANVPTQPSQNSQNTPGINSTMLNLDAQGNLQQGAMRTYVLETDISDKQKRSKRLSQTSTLGK
jgi:hypothetical protein